MRYDNPLCLGAVGTADTSAANIVAKEADLIIGIGTRYSDFTTASKTQFRNADVHFVNINVAEFDSAKHSAIPSPAMPKLHWKSCSAFWMATS
ncbi:MAG: hypothetical protein R2911_30010 [Caldilineaceae bacterium]